MQNDLPCTYHSFNPFRGDFEYKNSGGTYKHPPAYSDFQSCKGRVYCLIRLVCSPFLIPLKIVKKICMLVQAIFYAIAQFLRFGKEQYFNRVGGGIKHLIDRIGSLIFSPLNILVAHIRYLFGLLHPRVVFNPHRGLLG